MHNDQDPFQELDTLTETLPREIGGYTFEQMIGKGGFSRVFLVSTPKYTMKFVAKVMPASIITYNQTDIDYLRLLEHPNIIRIFDKFILGNMIYCIIEYCPGGSLQDLIKTKCIHRNDTLLYFMQQILLGLDFCHQSHIAHRDIKPSNILIDMYGRPKIIDFGISVKVEPGELVKVFSCSKAFQPPEILLEQAHDPFKADIWSLGVTFFHLATGKMPWVKKPEKVMNTAIEQAQYTMPKKTLPGIAAIIKLMIQVDPDDRPTLKGLLGCSLFPQDSILSLKENIFVNVNNIQFFIRGKNENEVKADASHNTNLKKLGPVLGKENSQRFFVVRKGTARCQKPTKPVQQIYTTMTSMDMFNCEQVDAPE